MGVTGSLVLRLYNKGLEGPAYMQQCGEQVPSLPQLACPGRHAPRQRKSTSSSGVQVRPKRNCLARQKKAFEKAQNLRNVKVAA